MIDSKYYHKIDYSDKGVIFK